MAAVKAVSMTDLQSLFCRQLSKAALDEAVQEFIAQGVVGLVKEKTKGRPKTLIKMDWFRFDLTLHLKKGFRPC